MVEKRTDRLPEKERRDAAFDALCKRILAWKAILARIMKHCLLEYRDCGVDEIMEEYIEGEPLIDTAEVMPKIRGMRNEDAVEGEGTVTYDILFYALLPKREGAEEKAETRRIRIYINIEVQKNPNPGYPLTKRGILYGARMLAGQYNVEYRRSHYENLRKVYSVWICPNVAAYRKNTIMRYQMTEEDLLGNGTPETRENYDLLTILLLGLGDPQDRPENEALRLLNTALSRKITDQEKSRVLREEHGINMTEDMREDLEEMGHISQIYIEEGRAEGRAEVHAEDLISLMDETGWPLERAMNVLHISDAERMDVRRRVEERLAVKSSPV